MVFHILGLNKKDNSYENPLLLDGDIVFSVLAKPTYRATFATVISYQSW